MESSLKSERNPYEVLGLTPGATDEEVRSAYFRLIRPFREHPRETDARAVERGRQISLAFQTLREAAKHRAYETQAGLARRPKAIEAGEDIAEPFIAKPVAQNLLTPTRETAVGHFIAATLRSPPARSEPTLSEHPPAPDASTDSELAASQIAPVEEEAESEADRAYIHSPYRPNAKALLALSAVALTILALWTIPPDFVRAPSASKHNAIGPKPSARAAGPRIESLQGAAPQVEAGAHATPPDAAEAVASSAPADTVPTSGAPTSQPAEVPPSDQAEIAASSATSGTVATSAPEAHPVSADSSPSAPQQPAQAAPVTTGRMTPAVLIGGGLYDSDNPHGMFQGTVNVHFTIRSDGSVTGCRPIASSGDPALDGHTCQLVEQRLRFKPALDYQGHPIVSEANGTYTWMRKGRRLRDWFRGRP